MSEWQRSDAYQRALDAGTSAWGAGWRPSLYSRAPGRLELLGNHIDYNGGPVLAAAIDRDVVCLLDVDGDPGIEGVFADARAERLRLDTESLRGWSRSGGGLQPGDYLRGTIATAIAGDSGVRHRARMAVAGDVPIGFGLSSSAALCVAATLALHDPPPAGRELVLRAQAAEHRAGTPCGTMDQSASVGGNVILYDGATVSWRSIAPDLGDRVFAVADSGVARSLASSSYPRRVEESRRALEIANATLGTTHAYLAELSDDEVAASASALPEVLAKRVRHVVSETERVHRGLDAMSAGDWAEFGRLMTASGRSSAQDYEISHPAVEALVAAALTVPGVDGARMMGGGEGGIALVLLHRSAVGDLKRRLDRDCYAARGMNAGNAVRVFQFAPGASIEPLAQ